MKDVIAKVQKCRDDTARTQCEDMYAKYPDGSLVKCHSKEDGEEKVRQLDSIIKELTAMESATPNVEARGCHASRQSARTQS